MARWPWQRRDTISIERATAVTASASRVRVDDRLEVERIRRAEQPWQSEAADYAKHLGEVRFAYSYASDVISRMRLFPAVQPVPDEDPFPADDETSPVPAPIAAQARANLANLKSRQGGQAELVRRGAWQLGTTGECYLTGESDDAGDDWRVRSIFEMRPGPSGWFEIHSGLGDSPQALPAEAMVARLWQPDPDYGQLADSSLRGVLASCRLLNVLDRGLNAQGLSRIGAGILAVPNELFTLQNGTDGKTMTLTGLADDLMDAMVTPTSDDGHPGSVTPMLVSGAADKLEQLRHIDLGRQFDEKTVEIIEKQIRRIAQGLPVPAEVVTGYADLNHWTGWLVSEEALKQIEPLVVTLCWALTVGYLRPSLEAAGVPAEWVSRLMVWYDPTPVVSRADMGKTATTGLEQFALSAKAWREHNNFSEDDAPTDDEVMRRLGIKRSILTAELSESLLRYTDPGFAPAPEEPTGDVPAPVDEETPPAEEDTGPPPAERPTARALAAAAGDFTTGVMVAFYPPPDLAAQLAVDGGLAVEDLHLTLAYLGDIAALDDAQQQTLLDVVTTYATGTDPVTGVVSGVGRFAGSDPDLGDAVYASVDCPDLPTWRQGLFDALVAAGLPVSETHGFTPHITLTYIPADEPTPVERLDLVDVTFASVAVVLGETRTDVTLGAPAVTAAADQGDPLADLGARLSSSDRLLRERLAGAADAAMTAALERAGAKARTAAMRSPRPGTTRAQREAQVAALLDGVPLSRAAAQIGKTALTAAGVDDAELLDGAFDQLGVLFLAWAAAAQAAAIDDATAALDVDDADTGAIRTAQADDRDSAWSWLNTALLAHAAARLFDPDPTPDAGEFDPTSAVPTGVLREAIARAGGWASDASSPDEPPSGLATGPRLRGFLAEHGVAARSWRWVYGSAPRKNFEPHRALAGVEFTRFDDPKLANSSGWPAVSHLHPGDHLGCQCDFVPVFARVAVPELQPA